MSIWNGFYRATVPAIVAVFCCHLNAANAATITVDYSDLASTLGDRDAVSNFGTTADVKFSYSTVNDSGDTQLQLTLAGRRASDYHHRESLKLLRLQNRDRVIGA